MEQIDYCGGPHYFIILTPLNRVAGFFRNNAPNSFGMAKEKLFICFVAYEEFL
jgi:hypothetical protein